MPTHTARRQRRKKRRKKQRLVYVIARPLKAAGPFSSLSGTEFALCHWGLFVTDPRDRDRNTSLSISALKGTLFELLRQENNINTPSTTTDFGVAQWKTEWKYVLITAVGETDVSDEELRAQGRHPKFKFLKTYSSKHDHQKIPRLRWIYQQLSKFRPVSPRVRLSKFNSIGPKDH
jgi:hypothetical protein